MEIKLGLISEDLEFILVELTRQKDLEKSIQSLVLNFIDTKISYYQLIDQSFQSTKGMKFDDYIKSKSEEWDGADWIKIQEFHHWEDAITGIEYYKDLLKKCNWTNLENKL